MNKGRGHNIKHPPLAFTEHGAIMVATILNSPQAVEMSVHVVRAFVKLRQMLASNTVFARRLESLERSVAAVTVAGKPNLDVPQGTLNSTLKSTGLKGMGVP